MMYNDESEPSETDTIDHGLSGLKPRQRAFLAAYRETGIILRAADLAKVGRSTVYEWRRDPQFEEAFQRALEDATEVLEAEARRRAVEGTLEPAGWYRGKAGGVVRKYSDVLLMFMLKGLKPETYRENVTVRASTVNIDIARLSDDQVERLAGGEHPLSVLGGSLGNLLGTHPAALMPAAADEDSET